MFSGIVEELGAVLTNTIATEGRLSVAASTVLADVRIGDSIAVNGCCLTVVASDPGGFSADVMPETGRRTNLGGLAVGDQVNLEASLRLGDRIGGHMVTGHIDGRGEVVEVHDEANARWVTIAAPDDMALALVARGCVGVDGISLTVVSVAAHQFTVSLIPHTLAATNAGNWQRGSAVNLESDLIAKYVRSAVDATSVSARVLAEP